MENNYYDYLNFMFDKFIIADLKEKIKYIILVLKGLMN